MKDLIRHRKPGRDPSTGGEQPLVVRRTTNGCKSRVNPTVSADAIAEARNALEAAHTSGDYQYQSVGDLIRAALKAHADGLALGQQARRGRRKRHTVELSSELLEHYQHLPNRSRGVIVERALLSFLAQGLGSR